METLFVVLVAAAVPLMLLVLRYWPYLFRIEPRVSPAKQAELWRGLGEAYVQGYRAGMKRD